MATVLTAQETEQTRQFFEQWFSDDGQWPQAVQRSGEGYRLAQAQSSWVAWQAATGACLHQMKIKKEKAHEDS